tara:strand:- start:202 stop:564 length:363 start_codon:yes stop_codon:yes gene_type:complete
MVGMVDEDGGSLSQECAPGEFRIAEVDTTGYGWEIGGAIAKCKPADPLEYWTPDLASPATLGCLLALVREAWDDTSISVRRDQDFEGWWVESANGYVPSSFAWDSEAEALVSALESAPAE